MITKIKKYGFLSLLTLSVFLASPAWANQKLAVVDYQKLVENSPQVTAVNKELETQFKIRREALLKQRDDLQKKLADLNRNQAVMGQEQIAKTQDELIAQRARLQADEQAFEQEFRLAQARAYDKFMKQVTEAIAAVAKEQGYDMVIRKQATPFVNNEYDITKLVSAKLK